MTIISQDMEIPILVIGPILWLSQFIVLNFTVLAKENKQTNK